MCCADFRLREAVKSEEAVYSSVTHGFFLLLKHAEILGLTQHDWTLLKFLTGLECGPQARRFRDSEAVGPSQSLLLPVRSDL